MNPRRQTKPHKTGQRLPSAERNVWIIFFVTLAAMAVGFALPEQRLWGFSHWAHFPWPYAAAALVLTALITVLTRRVQPASTDASGGLTPKPCYLYFSLAMVVILGAAFYLLRTRIHFLGDGYNLLANLASDEPIVKLRNLGETLARQFVYSLLEGDNSQRSLTAYRIVSISGGLFFTVTVLVCARLLFDSLRDRILFSLGMLSGGYMLLFFGYAEHYSLFVPVVGLFALMGLLVTRGKLNRFWILMPLGISVFLHIFGVILVPAAAYVLLRDTKLTAAWDRLAFWARAAMGLLVCLGATIVFYHYYTTQFFFRFSFVPIIEDQFTLQGYTMFSLKHLADVGNLLFMLFPGILVSAAYLIGVRVKIREKDSDYVFLLILLVTSLVVVSGFDPKLGMPRDWDLFAFCGIPLVMCGFYMVLRSAAGARMAFLAASLATLLGFVTLVPRVVSQVVPRLCLAQVYDYAMLDLKKSLFFLQHLHQYYWDHGQFERSPVLNLDYDKEFPEYTLLLAALELKKQGNCVDAVPLLKRAITLNPTMVPPYSNLGSCYLDLGFPDSALLPLRIADGLSPHRIQTLVDLGHAYILKRDLVKARRCLDRALSIDSDHMTARRRLLEVYSLEGELDKYLELLTETAGMENSPASVNRLLGDYYVKTQQIELAREQYFIAIRKGLTEEEVREIMTTFPDLLP